MTRSPGWNDDYSSDDPDHARKQGFAPATGPDKRQPEMVSRERYEELRQFAIELVSALDHVFRFSSIHNTGKWPEQKAAYTKLIGNARRRLGMVKL